MAVTAKRGVNFHHPTLRLPRRLCSAALVILIVTLSSCGGSSQDEATSTDGATTAPGDSRGPGQNGGLPRGCEPRQVGRILEGFATALNEGDVQAARSYLSQDPEFVFFSFNLKGARGKRTYTARSVPQVLDLIHDFNSTKKAHWLLSQAAVGEVGPYENRRKGPTSNEPVAGVDFVFRVDTSLVQRLGISTGVASGKSGINCERGQIYIWNMSMGYGAERLRLCGSQRSSQAGTAPVVCSYLTGTAGEA